MLDIKNSVVKMGLRRSLVSSPTSFCVFAKLEKEQNSPWECVEVFSDYYNACFYVYDNRSVFVDCQIIRMDSLITLADIVQICGESDC